ncbi:zinc finger protein 507 [Gouania willdenowi]|uniref:C2H2-type domain-containing protein n=1 Tax=Gouania willdenowi TaxID=441366 RepID=A0A8C5H143_GOUWI|nr:zinc finger protein 507 [Gouania willdenowi]
MEDVSNVAVLLSAPPPAAAALVDVTAQRHAGDSLIQVIEKLSKIVEKRPQRCCSVGGQKRAIKLVSRGEEEEGEEPKGSNDGSSQKRVKRTCRDNTRWDGLLSVSGDNNNNNMVSAPAEGDHRRTVTCYQCSLCPYLSQTLPLLREHLKQHNEQHSDLILMCSECHFTSRDQHELEAHVRLHFDDRGDAHREPEGGALPKQGGALSDACEQQQKKKWYSQEDYGLYRCLICSYVCSQQRMLKTHAWKHAGLVDCSYPIFEEQEESFTRREAHVVGASNAAATEDAVVGSSSSSSLVEDKSVPMLPAAFRLQLCSPPNVQQESVDLPVSLLHPKAAAEDEDQDQDYKDLNSEQVKAEADADVDDSLLSSAQKIINSSPNSAGHINVIVERLPSAEDSVLTTNPLLLDQDTERDASLVDVRTDQGEGSKEGTAMVTDAQTSVSSASSNDPPRDENVPPAGRKRTHSESLRLHSLAAEALVTMPMRTTELLVSNTTVRTTATLEQSPHVGHKVVEVTTTQKSSHEEAATAVMELHGQAKEKDLSSLSFEEGEDGGHTSTKAGISLSLLTVIERLRERTDQNATDEDILKELQDNAQFHNGAVGGGAASSYVDDLVSSPGGGGLVDYVPGSERPYQCRLCRYSSGTKGYIKQHLRVHRQRQPYQCPICEHVSSDSNDLENHMIHHCKSRTYHCKHCPDTFHYKSQLKSHERENHSLNNNLEALTETAATAEDALTVEDGNVQVFKCDVCSYTSSTYVGVRNHRRIHNSDKPYRCCGCDFATTNMNSLKSHMKRHPQEHQAVQLLEQYRCSLCGYVCSHPPSLKSHMWKHAGDQNYNYEQVNKAINEAISQSSRASQKVSSLPESVVDRPALTPHPEDTVEPPPKAKSLTTEGQSSAPPSEPRPQDKEPSPGLEYCMLLFCCCICSLEFTSKDRLMEHMKEHEGDIISIILNKEPKSESPAPTWS